ncbi:MAG: acyl-CoA thioesterase [Rhodobacteraceae bacterium]|nr:acyl-CoA thioesterase [Paracoccaceae bacterium]
MLKPTEATFVHKIRVAWADCDPAFIAYTGRIPYWGLESIDAWWEHTTGIDWYALNVDRKLDGPFVHMSLDFSSPVTPRHKLECEVSLLKLGTSSLRHRVIGRQNGKECFRGEFVSVLVDSKTFKACPPPEDLRKLLLAE